MDTVGFIDNYPGEAPWELPSCKSYPQCGTFFYPREDDNIARFGAFGLNELKRQNMYAILEMFKASRASPSPILTRTVLRMGAAVHYLANRLTAKVIRIRQVGNKHLEWFHPSYSRAGFNSFTIASKRGRTGSAPGSVQRFSSRCRPCRLA